MGTSRIGRIVTTAVVIGHVGALVVVLGPLAGSSDSVTTGTALLACAAGWGALLAHPTLRMAQPQRWAALPAGFMAVAGTGVLVFAPADSTMSALGWVWPPLWIAVALRSAVLAQRTLRGRSRWLVQAVLTVYTLAGIGAGYQTIGDARDLRTTTPAGRLIDIGGHRLHLHCAGAGSPAVILEAGLGETGATWSLVSDAMAGDTTVCAYDRAGRGWSDAAPGPQDGAAVAADLHRLLGLGHVAGPYVLVGHSTGAQYVRTFAGRYPEQVAGMVLLDGQPAEAFEALPDYPTFYARLRRVSSVLPLLARLGLARLVVGVPAREAASLRDEIGSLPTSLHQARTFQNLGDRPLVVVAAAEGALRGWLPLQAEMATLSRNSSHRVVPFTHAALITDPVAVRASVQAIHDVVEAVRLHAPLR